MPVQSLKDLCYRGLCKGIDYLTDIGEIPYQILRPALMKIENPQQLKLLESMSPQLIGADAEIWRGFIKRDIPKWQDKIYEPKNPKNWWKVYETLAANLKQELDDSAELLKARMKDLKAQKDTRQSKIVNKEDMPPVPKMDGMQYQHLHNDSNPEFDKNRRRRRVNVVVDHRPNYQRGFVNGSRTKTLTAKGVMAKAQREAREMSRLRVLDKLAAPKKVVEDHKTTKPVVPIKAPGNNPVFIPPPRKKIDQKDKQLAPRVRTMEEREEALRAIKRSTHEATAPPAPPSKTSTSTTTKLATHMRPSKSTTPPMATASTSTTKLNPPSANHGSNTKPSNSRTTAAVLLPPSSSSSLKRKASDASEVIPSTEFSSPERSLDARDTSPARPAYKVPRPNRQSPDTLAARARLTRKKEVSPFIPPKKVRAS
ncbi:MAG: hypothetical protein LQ351_000917 [Letrouitia transgressa]|nr:MAG: hypothetical protein LQ351_000917 [Letrouitia transgressa]